ncbi:hypothetical protein [Burkholderia cepacia]|uniref:hypothetical protein n=1 Tax=Burkholderia cepacia TaxID=292 RepID=UPI0011D1C7FF|nr:hypothetical protein [Burkholderia cepacia]
MSVVVARRTASGVLNESRFMMVRFEQGKRMSGVKLDRRPARHASGRRPAARPGVRSRGAGGEGSSDSSSGSNRARKQVSGATCDDQRRRHPAGACNRADPLRTAIGSGRSGTPPASSAALAVIMISSVFIGLSARFCRLQCEFLNPSKTFWIADFRSGH